MIQSGEKKYPVSCSLNLTNPENLFHALTQLWPSPSLDTHKKRFSSFAIDHKSNKNLPPENIVHQEGEIFAMNNFDGIPIRIMT
jgi:hypothetical protein